MVVLPLGVLSWLGIRIVRHERELVQQQFIRLLDGRLQDADRSVVEFFQREEVDLLKLADLPDYDTANLRRLVRTEPRMRQLFVLLPDGDLLHPPMDAPRNESEEAFLTRAAVFLRDKDLVRLSNGSGAGEPDRGAAANSAFRLDTETAGGSSSHHGWFVWYYGRGLELIFWCRRESGHIVGIELDRARWKADLISSLPETSSDKTASDGASRVQLVDSNGDTVYQWGQFDPPDGTGPLVERALSEPLESWRLRYFADGQGPSAVAGRGTRFGLVAGLSAFGMCLVGLAVYLYRESSHELREAATRVTFVNQVSHELKTPLTNIRMYAELLEQEAAASGFDSQGKVKPYLQVIVGESERLSRLISNVLTFARQQRGKLRLRPRTGSVDEVVRQVAEQFEPAMSERSIKQRLNLAASGEVQFDHDAVEQILVNLLNNVEKYAGGDGRLDVTTNQSAGRTTIVIADQGPGIAPEHRERIFQPFYRASDKLEAVAGAGIGLAIARDLARLHGGDVTLLRTEIGAAFQLELSTPAATA